MKYAKLSKAAKERARQWYKDAEGEMWGQDRAPDYYEDMATCLKFLGITVDCERTMQHRVLLNGAIHEWERTEWGFEWSGFWSQGDGLVFKGTWSAEHVSMSELKEYAPQDVTLERICAQMMALMLRHPAATADITTVSYGPGLPGMHIDGAIIGFNEAQDETIPMPEADEMFLREQMIAAAHWCYKQLEDNYEYDTSDEAAVEGIEANEYDFNRNGERIDIPTRRAGQRVGATACPA